MLDTFGRDVRAMRLAITEACDLRCRYCVPETGISAHGKPLTVDELVEIAEAGVACGITKIRITGGEPLMRPDAVTICERIARLEGMKTLCMTTNGTRLAALAGELRRAGVTRLNLSLDSLEAQRYADMTRGGDLRTVLDGLQAALATGFERVKINCVLIGGVNDSEIPAFVELTQRLPVDVRFIELMPMGECARWPAECFLCADTVLARCPTLTPIPDEGVARRYRLPGAKGAVGLIQPMSHSFCGDCDRVRVTADGKMKPCLHSAGELNLCGLHGEDLRACVAEGIGLKPAEHHLGEGGTETDRRMSQIGG